MRTREKLKLGEGQRSVPYSGGKKAAPKREGHEQLFHELARNNELVIAHITPLMSDEPISGELMDSDRFTITVRTDYAPHGLIVFKHAIESVYFITD